MKMKFTGRVLALPLWYAAHSENSLYMPLVLLVERLYKSEGGIRGIQDAQCDHSR